MDLGIKGKWALVCGASKGLGLGCAQALVADGANVLINARGAEALEAAASSLRSIPGAGKVLAVACDITTPEGRAAVFGAAGGPGKDFDIVVTNAGGPPPGDFREWERDAWIKAIDANMLTSIFLIKATVDGMVERRFGRVVNITSSAVKAPIDVLGLSNGARSGLTGFIAGIARNFAQHNVTINNLLPGRFATDRLTANFPATAKARGVSVEQVADELKRQIPARRFGDPHEFGEACAYLCSAQAGYVTGQNFLIDGGAYPGTF